MNQYLTDLRDYSIGFTSPRCTLHPAFVSYDSNTDRLEELRPEQTPDLVVDPKAYGDDWNDSLAQEEVKAVCQYFRSFRYLDDVIDFIALKVGGREHRVEFRKRRGEKKGIRFEVPRHSLMHAISYECFDDLLVGNFMRTCLFGKWPLTRLYPDFSPYVAKYGDNGGAKTAEELRRYFAEYRRRAGAMHYLHAVISGKASQLIYSRPSLYYAARGINRFVEGRLIYETHYPPLDIWRAH